MKREILWIKLADNVWYFRFKKFKDKYLITNDVGKWSFLSEDDFFVFLKWELKDDKYDELVEKWFIIDDMKAYKDKMIQWFRKKNEFIFWWPSLHIIVTTLRCNHKCRYCHAAVASMDQKELDMSKETAQKVVDTIFYTSNPNITIEFQWWEPLVNWEIIKFIVEYAEEKACALKKNLKFALVTNLTLMDEKKLDYILKHKISISTSLDGDEQLHNYNRVFTGWNSFKEVTYWIKRINEEYKKRWIKDKWGEDFVKVWALLTVTRKTLSKYKEVIDTYVDLGLDGIFLRHLNPYGFAANQKKELGYTADEFFEFYKNSMDYILEINKKWTKFREMLSSIYLSKILTDKDPNYLDERSPCGACIWQVAYNYDGKIFSCDEWRMLGRMWDLSFMMTEVTDSWEETYKSMINSETTKIMVQASTLDWLPGYNEDVYKPYIGVCPIYNYKTTWNIYPVYAKDNRRRLNERILDYLFEKLRDEENKKIFESWLWIENNIVTSQCETI